jgi:hypothetical protein
MRCESLSLAYIIVPMHTRTSNSGTNMLELLTFYEKNAHACSTLHSQLPNEILYTTNYWMHSFT